MEEITTIDQYLDQITNKKHREKFEEVLKWIETNYPNLQLEMHYQAPMFTDHGTYIIGVNAFKKHYSIAVEGDDVEYEFKNQALELGFETLKKSIQIPYNIEIPTDFLKEIIDFRIDSKKDCTTFWIDRDLNYDPNNY